MSGSQLRSARYYVPRPRESRNELPPPCRVPRTRSPIRGAAASTASSRRDKQATEQNQAREGRPGWKRSVAVLLPRPVRCTRGPVCEGPKAHDERGVMPFFANACPFAAMTSTVVMSAMPCQTFADQRQMSTRKRQSSSATGPSRLHTLSCSWTNGASTSSCRKSMTQQAGSVDYVAALVEKERCVAGAELGWATHRSLAQSRSGAPAKKVGGRESGLTTVRTLALLQPWHLLLHVLDVVELRRPRPRNQIRDLWRPPLVPSVSPLFALPDRNPEETSSWCFEIRNPAPNVLPTLYIQRHCPSSHTPSPTHHSLFH